MTNGATLTVDTREFSRVARLLADTDKRTFPQFINGQLLAVGRAAIKQTHKANRMKIEKQMGVVKNKAKLRGGKKGARGWVRIKEREFGNDISRSFAARIVNAARKRAGLELVWGDPMRELARKLVAQKVKSAGFMRSGWIEAVKFIARKAYQRGASLGGTGNAGPRGYAVPATFVLSGVVRGEIGNTVPSYRRKGGPNFPNPPNRAWTGPEGNVMPFLVRGLQAAINMTTADMGRKLAERLQRDFNAQK